MTRPEGEELTLTADVVVIGSGSGGGVVAGHLATQGKDVVVLEAGGYYNEADFNQLELWAYENLYRAGGMSGTADGRIALMTGANLGGGSTVNWTNCLRTYPWVREEWETEHGLEGLERPGLRPHPRHGQRAHQRHRPLLGLEPDDGDAEGRVRGARARLPADHAQRGRGALRRRPRGAHGLRRRERREELHAEDVAAGRRGRGRALRRELPRRARARRGRPRRGRRGHVRRRRRPDRAGDRVGADGRRRGRRARHAGRAAAQRHRRAGGGRLPAPASRDRRSPASTTRRRRPGGDRRSPACRWRWPTSRTATATSSRPRTRRPA